MTVIRPNSVSGINSITAQADEIKVFKSNGTQGGLIIGGANLNATSGISTLLALNVTGNVSIAGTLTYQDVTNVDSIGIITARAGVNVSAGQLDVGGNIKLGNAGVITATTFVGNLTGTATQVSLASQSLDTDCFPVFSLTATGNQTLHTKSNRLSFNSATGALSATSFVGDGSNLTGISQVGGSTGVNFNDNTKAQFGTSNDLQIFHNGSHSYIGDYGTGTLRIEGSEIGIISADGSKTMAQFVENGAVSLRHNNGIKFATLTNGVQTTGSEFISEGTIYLEKGGVHHHRILSNDTGNDLGFQQSADNGANTNFTTYLRINNGGNISLPVDSQVLNLGASQDMQLYHNGTDSYILNATGNFRIGQYNNANLKFFTSNSTRWEINGSGHFLPDANNSFDIGSTSKRERNIYTMDLHCSNKGSSNDVDGTWGDWTLQEGESDMFMINNRSGKKFKIKMEEVS